MSRVSRKSLRKRKDEERYVKFKDENKEGWEDRTYPLEDNPPIKKYKYWVIIQNEFPWSLILEVSHMLVPLRIFSDIEDMNEDEFNELKKIKKDIYLEYDSMLFNFSERSGKAHFHFHLLKWVDRDGICDNVKEFIDGK